MGETTVVFGNGAIGHLVTETLSARGSAVRIAQRSRPADPNFERTPYDELTAYGRSKTATILFAVEFDRRHNPAGIRATAVHPGAALTENVEKMIEALGDGKDAAVAAYNWKTVPQGAATGVWASVAATAGDVGARYCENCHVAEVVDDLNSRVGVRAYALDSENAKALWARSEALVREQF